MRLPRLRLAMTDGSEIFIVPKGLLCDEEHSGMAISTELYVILIMMFHIKNLFTTNLKIINL